MDQNNPVINVDSDLSESWTLLDKESSETGDFVHGDESSNEDAAREEMETSKSISYASDSSYGKLPLECPGTAQNEGTESLDSDGISIISESEEEELKLLPCNSAVIEDRPCSRSSNKYFDETDTASQHSMQDVPVFNNKKYKHHPNNNLNTSLNVLLIVAWAAVIGLGMGHFLGLQEECPSGIKADDKIDAQTEELSVGLLKKLELENTALKEQFANLQKMMEEMNKRKAISSCKVPPQIPDGHGAVDLDKSVCLEDSIKRQLMEEHSGDLSNYDQFAADIKARVDGEIKHLDERVLQTAPDRDAYHSSDSSAKSDGLSEKASLNKNMIIEKLEQSLDDVASLFREKLNPNKISMENPREALSGTISVLSGLVENLKEKVLTIKDSLQTDSLDFEKPIKAITKMEEILQKTSDKMQKITLDAFKEGKPLHSISNKVTSKLQAINKKLEEKWCLVKQHLSKQNLIWNWLDGQIFQNCNDDSRIKGEEIQNHQKGKEAPAEKAGEEFIDEGSEEKGKYKNSKSNRKIEDESNNVEYKGKQKTESIKLDKTKERYRKKGWLNPYSFDNQPGKGGKAEVGKKREKIVSKNEKKDEKGDYRVGKNEGRHSKVNKSGEWMEAMFNHRAERRQDERRSDWYFTRARSRTRIRESLPSRWYFRRGETKI